MRQTDDPARCLNRGKLIAELAIDMAIGAVGDDSGAVGAVAVVYVVHAILELATGNTEPRRVLEVVVSMFDAADVEGMREQRKARDT